MLMTVFTLLILSADRVLLGSFTIDAGMLSAFDAHRIAFHDFVNGPKMTLSTHDEASREGFCKDPILSLSRHAPVDDDEVLADCLADALYDLEREPDPAPRATNETFDSAHGMHDLDLPNRFFVSALKPGSK
eukprot:440744-Pleurochrysis_carterae.AAC.6